MARKKTGTGTQLSTDKLLGMYRTILTIRRFEEQIQNLHTAGLVPGLAHLYSGQEAVAAGVCAALDDDDWIASHHRGHGHCIAKGADLRRLFAELLGRREGYGMGRGGSMHVLDPASHNLGTNGIVGGSVPLASGAALSAKVHNSGQIAVSFFGDGVLNGGILFESMNMAAIWSLPVVYVCENNGYGEFTETDTVTAGSPYTARGEAFGIPSINIDGMDLLAVHAAMATAVTRARKGEGPSFLICNTYRYSGHHAGDRQDYKDETERRQWEERDPIVRLRRHLIEKNCATEAQLAAIDAELHEAVRDAAEYARNLPEPDPSDLMSHVLASG